MLLLTLYLRQIDQAFHHLAVFQVLDILECQQYLVRCQSVPMNFRRVVHKLSNFSVFLSVPHSERNSDGEGDSIFYLKIWRTHMKLPIVSIQSIVILFDSLIERSWLDCLFVRKADECIELTEEVAPD